MEEMVGKVIEFKNARKDIVQKGVIIDKILYKEKNTDLYSVTGYLVKTYDDATVRVVKPIRVTRVIPAEPIAHPEGFTTTANATNGITQCPNTINVLLDGVCIDCKNNNCTCE